MEEQPCPGPEGGVPLVSGGWVMSSMLIEVLWQVEVMRVQFSVLCLMKNSLDVDPDSSILTSATCSSNG